MKPKRIWALLLALGMLALAVCGCQKEQSVEEWEAKELERVMQAQAAEDAAAEDAEEDDTDFDKEDGLDDLEPSAEDLASAEDFEKDL